MKAVPPYVLALVGLLVLCLAVGALGYLLAGMLLGNESDPGNSIGLASSTLEHDDSVIGRIMGVEGTAYVDDPSGKRRTGETGVSIYSGDTLVTMQKSKLYVTFEDRSALFLGEKSRMVIDEYVYRADRKFEANCAMRLVRGVCRVLSGKIVEMNPKRFHVRSRMATIGIRGCEIGIRSSPNIDLIYMLTIPDEKEIVVTASEDASASVGESVRISEQETIVTVSREKPIVDRPMEPEELVALVEETTVGLAGLTQNRGLAPANGGPGQEGFYEIFEKDSAASLKLKMEGPHVPIESWGKWLHVDKIIYRLKLPPDVGVFVKGSANVLSDGALRADNLPTMLSAGTLRVVFDDHDRSGAGRGKGPDEFLEKWRAERKLYAEMFAGKTNVLESQRLEREIVLDRGEKWLRVTEIVYAVPLPEPVGVLVKQEDMKGEQGYVTVKALLDLLMRGAVVTVPDKREDFVKPVVPPSVAGDDKIREVTFKYLEVIYDGGVVEIPVAVGAPGSMPAEEWERIVIGSGVSIGNDDGMGPGILYKPGEKPVPPGPVPPTPRPPTPRSPTSGFVPGPLGVTLAFNPNPIFQAPGPPQSVMTATASGGTGTYTGYRYQFVFLFHTWHTQWVDSAYVDNLPVHTLTVYRNVKYRTMVQDDSGAWSPWSAPAVLTVIPSALPVPPATRSAL